MLPILLTIVTGIRWLIVIDAVLSWVMPEERFPRSLTKQLTDPLYAPIRAVLRPERTGGFDLSPLIVLGLLIFFENMIARSVY
ncbi:MAG TPA: YggT family protein [Polyangiales bacterium]|nr:YggT family protein [Polyangiales bacterium]